MEQYNKTAPSFLFHDSVPDMLLWFSQPKEFFIARAAEPKVSSAPASYRSLSIPDKASTQTDVRSI